MTRTFTPEMGEISGFGGGYEAQCRKMLLAGVAWLDENPDKWPKFDEHPQIFGITTPEDEGAKALDKAVCDAAGSSGFSGAMHHAVVQHLTFIAKNGWDKYVEEMSKPDEEDEDE
jgi:hypothetical protein